MKFQCSKTVHCTHFDTLNVSKFNAVFIYLKYCRASLVKVRKSYRKSTIQGRTAGQMLNAKC